VHEPYKKYALHRIEHRKDCQGNMARALSFPLQGCRKWPIFSLAGLLIPVGRGLLPATYRGHAQGTAGKITEEFGLHPF
jgi:hypothetical protein